MVWGLVRGENPVELSWGQQQGLVPGKGGFTGRFVQDEPKEGVLHQQGGAEASNT